MEQASLFGAPGDFDLGAPAQRRSHASRRAAERLQAEGRLGARMARILGVFRAAHPGTLIPSEVVSATGILRQSLCSPLAIARSRKWLEAVGVRPGPHGADQTSYRITETGLEALKAFEAQPPKPPRRRA